MLRRPWLFWSGLPVASQLMFLAVFLLLGYWISIDIQFGLWPVTFPLIVGAIALSRLLLPLMMKYPDRAQQFLGFLGLAVMGAYLLCQREWWWRTVLAHFGRTATLWFHTSCYFWFVSEIKRREKLIHGRMAELAAQHGEATDDERDDEREDTDR